MGLDTVLKRYFALIIMALIGLAAWFQASGVSRWVGSRFAVDAQALAASPGSSVSSPTAAPAASDPHSRTGEAVIQRNPFDSVTGPLIKGDAGLLDGDVPSAPVDFSNPYGAPDCTDNPQVIAIAASDDPAWSMAVLGTTGPQSKSQMRRIGDSYGAKRIWYIAWDRLWLQGDGELCQVRMFKPPAPPASAAPAAAAAPSGAPPKGGPAAVPEDIASKIQKVSATEFNVDRSVVDKILENQAELMRSARIVPEQENGKVVGIRMFGIRPETLLGTLGMQNGDRLESINGFNMASPEKALEAYARLRTANHLTVSLNRGGKPMNIDFNIK
ncbi:MAG: general secretion pathway protein GspC [Deltaproteobacteria bacterium]|nr:general secretion pathway protein GspC [Deltaproteobacteria bacterium]